MKMIPTNYLIKFQKNKLIKRYILLLILFSGFTALSQRDIPPKPSEQTSVYDEADMLSSADENRLEKKLINYADTTSTQIVIVTVETLNGEYEGTYAAHWAHEWGIGQSEQDNGLLVLVAEKERKIWISTGYGLEEYLTDAKTKEIIELIILPEFRTGNIYAGLNKGTNAIFQVLNGTFQGAPGSKGTGGGLSLRAIVFFIIFIMILISMFKKRGGGGNGGRRTGRSVLWDAIILSSLGRGSFGGGSSGGGFGGGGFGGGFGGGGFGGGGAGGSW